LQLDEASMEKKSTCERHKVTTFLGESFVIYNYVCTRAMCNKQKWYFLGVKSRICKEGAWETKPGWYTKKTVIMDLQIYLKPST